MAKIGLIRCEKNENRCPLTACIRSLENKDQAFSSYDDTELTGVFTCRCPGDNVAELAKILKSKGAEAIHLCTCAFAHKEEGKWIMDDGFCDKTDDLAKTISEAAGLPCIKGTAHLPEGYVAVP